MSDVEGASFGLLPRRAWRKIGAGPHGLTLIAVYTAWTQYKGPLHLRLEDSATAPRNIIRIRDAEEELVADAYVDDPAQQEAAIAWFADLVGTIFETEVHR